MFWNWKRTFILALTACALTAGSFAASGGLTESEQYIKGKKVFDDNVPDVATLSATRTLSKASHRVQILDANGSSRTINLPAYAASKGYEFFFKNSSSTAVSLVIKDPDAATVVTVAQNESGYAWCDGVAWYGVAFSAASSGFLPASGATTGATSQTQIFTNGVTLDAIAGNTAASTFAFTGKAGSSAAGQPITVTGGAGNGAFDGGAMIFKGGASGAGATGAGGAATVQGGGAASTDGAGGAVSATGGAGAGSGAGGAFAGLCGAGGATGAGGNWASTAGRGGSTSGAAGTWTGTAGAGGAATTTTGGIAKIVGGGSGTGATGNGGAAQVTGGAALSTAGNGGAVTITGGVGTTTGTSGGVTIASGADGAGGTVGNITIDTGTATGTAGSISIGATNGAAMTVGRSGQTVTLPGVVAFTGTQTRTLQRYCFGVGGAKIGATAGFVVNAASNISAATCPASQTGSTLIVPIPYLKSGAIITGFGLCGQIESAGGACTVDVDLRVQTAAAADFTDASVSTMTQISVTADTKIDSTQDKTSISQTVAQDESYYLKITVTTAAATDVDIRGVRIIVTEK